MSMDLKDLLKQDWINAGHDDQGIIQIETAHYAYQLNRDTSFRVGSQLVFLKRMVPEEISGSQKLLSHMKHICQQLAEDGSIDRTVFPIGKQHVRNRMLTLDS